MRDDSKVARNRTAKISREVPARGAAGRRGSSEALSGADDLSEATIESVSKPPPPVEELVSAEEEIRPASLWLLIESGPSQGKSIPVPDGELTIGRSSSNVLKIPHPSVSRRHATLVRHGDRLFIHDSGSHNGTIVNGHKISGQIELTVGDEITLGLITLALHGDGRRAGSEGERALPWAERPAFKYLVFGGAAAAGLLTVLAVAALGGALRGNPAAPERTAEVAARPSPVAAAPVAARVERSLREDKPVGDISLVGETDPPPEPAVRPTPRPTPAPAPRRDGPAPREVKVASAASARSEARAGRTPALELYEVGALDAAINAARSEGNPGLAARIAEVKKEYATARADLSFNEEASAIAHLQKALAIDEDLSTAQSRTGQAIRAQLGKLYLNQGLVAFDKGDNVRSIMMMEQVLKYEPGNERARTFLAKLKKVQQGRPVDPRKAADQAFADPVY